MALPKRLKALLPQVALVSIGGPTETCVLDICYLVTEVDPNWISIPYGKPMRNTQYDVLNDNLDLCPIWVPGELCIAGAGLARGYWRDPIHPEAKFVIHPQTGTRLYRSGDVGRYLPDGNLELLGRKDFQVKIRGQRIELGEIEAILLQHPDVQAGIAHIIHDTDDQKQLVAYIVRQQAALSANDPILHLQEAAKSPDVIRDALARAEFKLSQKGIRPFEGQDQIDLPRTDDHDRRQQYFARQSYRQFVNKPISLQGFGTWLNHLGQFHLDDVPLPKYLYPSGGGLYPVQTYLYIKPDQISGVTGGYYYYHPVNGQLMLLETNHDSASRLFVQGHHHIFAAAAFAVFLVGDLKAIQPMDGVLSRDYCLLEAGYMSQLLMQTAPSHPIGLCPMGIVDEPLLCESLALDADYVILHALVGGRIDDSQMTHWLSSGSSQTGATPSESPPPGEPWQIELRTFLQAKLPAYMIPTTFVELASLPLSANGKVNRQALPIPERQQQERSTTFVAPRTPIEEQIAEIWCEVLNCSMPSVHQDLFDLGGDSLVAARLLVRLRQSFSVDLTLRTIFPTPPLPNSGA